MSMVFIYCCSCTCRPTDEAGGLMGYFGKALSPSSYLPVHVSRSTFDDNQKLYLVLSVH